MSDRISSDSPEATELISSVDEELFLDKLDGSPPLRWLPPVLVLPLRDDLPPPDLVVGMTKSGNKTLF